MQMINSPRSCNREFSLRSRYFHFAIIVLAAALIAWMPTASAQQTSAQSAAKGKAKARPQAGPTPRLPNGQVDLGGEGVWSPRYVVNMAQKRYADADVDVPFLP